MVTEIEYNSIIDYATDKMLCDQVGTYREWLQGYQQSRKKVVKEKLVAKVGSRFQELWDAYPTSANFSINGMKFTAGRVLRSNYQICQMLYDKAIVEGVDHDKMVAAIKKQVQILKEESYESGKNHMAFFPAIEPYMRQRKYEAFMDIEDETEYQQQNHNSA